MISRMVGSKWLRRVLFVVTFLCGYAGSTVFPLLSTWSNLGLVGRTLSDVFFESKFAGLSEQLFAYALACSIVSIAFGCIVAFGLVQTMLTVLAVRQARLQFSGSSSPAAFAANFESVSQSIGENPIVGHSWNEFVETGERQERIVRNTVRPQAFINMNAVREGSIGLKIMGTVPGYFMGLGLLLTFIGLVIALSKAAAGASGGDAATMTQSLRELLNAATFKFSTSIAGLFASILLSFIFKLYNVSIESALHKLNREIERVYTTLTPQAVSREIARDTAAQLVQIKEINTDKFFQRMGEQIAPQIKVVLQEAFQPLTEKLDASVGRLEDSSQKGVEGLLSRFQENLSAGAGTEMREIAGSIRETRETLSHVQNALQVTTEALGTRLDTSMERFASIADQSREQFLASNSQGIAQLQTGIEAVIGRVNESMGTFQSSLSEYQKRIGENAKESTARVRAASEAAAKASNDAVEGIAKAIQDSVGEAVAKITRDVAALSQSLQSAEKAFTAQVGSMREAVSGSSEIASSFRKVASDVSTAAAPLVSSSREIRASTEALSSAVTSALSAISESHATAKLLGEKLVDHTDQIRTVWSNYEQRFANVDASLEKAISALSGETDKYAQNLKAYVQEIDKGCAEAVQRLSQIANDLGENTEALNENFGELNRLLKISETA
jgi:Mg2+ and Co2+ transporter CorA